MLVLNAAILMIKYGGKKNEMGSNLCNDVFNILGGNAGGGI